MLYSKIKRDIGRISMNKLLNNFEQTIVYLNY